VTSGEKPPREFYAGTEGNVERGIGERNATAAKADSIDAQEAASGERNSLVAAAMAKNHL